MNLYNKLITINGKKVGKARLRNYLLKQVEEGKLIVKKIETNTGFSDYLLFTLPPDQDGQFTFDISTSNNWSTFCSDMYNEKKENEIFNHLQIQIKSKTI